MTTETIGYIIGHLLGTLIFVICAHIYFKIKDGEGLF